MIDGSNMSVQISRVSEVSLSPAEGPDASRNPGSGTDLLAKIGADTAENEQHFAKRLTKFRDLGP